MIVQAMRLLSRLLACIALLSVATLAQDFPGRYHTYGEAIADLQALEAAHPAFCSLDSVGYSNRDHLAIYQFKISDNVDVEEDEPAIFFDGGVHADEVLGVEVVLNFCNNIVTRYATGDTSVTRYVDNYEIFAMPFVNPEGHVVVENGDTEWRKNKTDNNHNGLFDFHDGVDCNRNYDFGWNIDVDANATTPESLEYKGPYPFSESEVRALRDLGQKYKPLIAVDYHSPTYGRAEKVYYNWYWYPSDGGHGMAPDEQSMYHIGRGFAGSIINDQGDSTYEARRALVNKGDFKTYFYGNFGTASFVCEISDTTIQDTAMIDPICQHNLAGMYYLLYRAGFARLTGVVTDSVTNLPLDAEVEVQQATSPDINPRHTRLNSGRYDRLIDPATYTLVFRKTGYVTKTVSGVTVTNSGPTVTNVRLVPQNPVPGTPTLLSPPNAATFNDSTALNFDWSDASGATSYVIEIAINSGFTNYLQVDSSVTASNFRNTVPFSTGTFYWRVTAHNSYGYSSRSAAWHFTINMGTPPLSPVLVYPPNYTIFADSTALNFDWGNAIGADGYIIEIATDSNFVSYLEFDSTVTLSNYRNIAQLYADTFYWRVTAYNEYGFSPRSTVWQFAVTAPGPPPAPVLVYPVNNSIFGDSIALNFDWSDAAGADGYVMEIALNSNFMDYFEFDSTVTPSSYRNIAQLYPDTFYWRVTAFNSHGYSSRSNVWQFGTTNNPPPLPPDLLQPGDGFMSSHAFLDFDWSDPASAQRYAILIGPDTLFSPPLISDTTLLVSAYHNADSLANGAYFWKVRARNANGWSAFSSIWTFTVDVDTGVTYTVGDVNHSGTVNGIDVVYLVGFFKGGPPPPLEIDGFYPEADVNGNCIVNGLDVGYLVNYFKGGPPLIDGNCLR